MQIVLKSRAKSSHTILMLREGDDDQDYDYGDDEDDGDDDDDGNGDFMRGFFPKNIRRNNLDEGWT